MSVLCANGCHVYRVGNLHCTCGAAANGYSPHPWTTGCRPSGVAMVYGFPPSYSPAPRPTAPDVPLSRLKAAKDVKAQYLSADGLRAYRDDRGGPEVAHWDAERRAFDSWWACEGLAPDAVSL